MDMKLTLKMDQAVIGRMKSYAARNRRSISRITEGYFRTLTGSRQGSEPKLAGVVAELAGILRDSRVTDHKAAYRRHIEEKYR